MGYYLGKGEKIIDGARTMPEGGKKG